MNLSPEEAQLFYKLHMSLLVYANRHLAIRPRVATIEEFLNTSLEQKVKLRDALYDHPELIDRFVAENPEGFTAEELAEIQSWAGLIRGHFFIVRHLKRFTVFVTAEPPYRAYGVLGLSSDLAEAAPDFALPVYVRAVLLPFRKRIVYDGFLEPAAITFGAGYRASINDAYRTAREREGIIETLDPMALSARTEQAATKRAQKEARGQEAVETALPVVSRIVEEAAGLKGFALPLQTRAIGLIRAAATLAQVALTDPNDPDELFHQIRRTRSALSQFENALDRHLTRE